MISQRIWPLVACLFGATPTVFPHAGLGQVVQLPTMGTFSIQTTVSVPDSGSANAGGGRYAASGINQRGSARGAGALTLANGTSVHATVIDLNELDKMIRSQSGKEPFEPDLSREKSIEKAKSIANAGKPVPPPQYAYLMAMSHSVVDNERGIEDARYYLTLASEAKRKSQWGAVELYYQLAWKSLPESRRNSALASLVKSRDKAQNNPNSEGTRADDGANQAKSIKGVSF